MRISTITVHYIPLEDRLKCAVVDKEANKCVLWITRRLAESLVASLVKQITDGPLKPELDANATPTDTPSPQPDDARQVYAQLEARLNKKSATPVEIDDATVAQRLIHEVRMSIHTNRAVSLRFAAPDKPEAVLVLTETELRQWLEVLRQCFRAAQWRHDIWPEWLRPNR